LFGWKSVFVLFSQKCRVSPYGEIPAFNFVGGTKSRIIRRVIMKNLYKFLGIITIVAVIGFSLAGCGDNGDPSSPSSGGNNSGGNNSGGNDSGGNNSGGNNSGGNDNNGGYNSGGTNSGGNNSGGNNSGGNNSGGNNSGGNNSGGNNSGGNNSGGNSSGGNNSGGNNSGGNSSGGNNSGGNNSSQDTTPVKPSSVRGSITNLNLTVTFSFSSSVENIVVEVWEPNKSWKTYKTLSGSETSCDISPYRSYIIPGGFIVKDGDGKGGPKHIKDEIDLVFVRIRGKNGNTTGPAKSVAFDAYSKDVITDLDSFYDN
jgi:PPE-repeat protein